MPLLNDTDYVELKERGISYFEDEEQRFLILPDYLLPDGLYHEKSCDVLVIIPQTYNQSGIDMLWTHPHLTRIDGKAIPNMAGPGYNDNRIYKANEFCRWSRHWNHAPVAWRAGKDNVFTILHRITWALNNPDANK